MTQAELEQKLNRHSQRVLAETVLPYSSLEREVIIMTKRKTGKLLLLTAAVLFVYCTLYRFQLRKLWGLGLAVLRKLAKRGQTP